MSVARNVLLALSTNAWLREHATRTAFVRRSVSTFMPGEKLADAMAAATAQQAQGVGTIFTRLGENVTRADEAEEVTRHYLDVLDRVREAGPRAERCVKATRLRLHPARATCAACLRRRCHQGARCGSVASLDRRRPRDVGPRLTPGPRSLPPARR